jgi:hypothetical protein
MDTATTWRVAALLAAALVVGVPDQAGAHDPGLSSLDVRVLPGGIVVTLSMAPADGRALADSSGITLDAVALEAIELRANGVRLPGAIDSRQIDAGDVGAVLTFTGSPGDTLTIRSGILERLAFGHRQLLRLHTADGLVMAERMLDARANQIDVDLPVPRQGRRAAEFLAIGVRHILSGYFHLLLLGALLLGLRARFIQGRS